MNPRYTPLTIMEQTALTCYARRSDSPHDARLSAWLTLALFLRHAQSNNCKTQIRALCPLPSSSRFLAPIEHRLHALFAE